MKNVHFLTIADLRAVDSDGFDAAIKNAVRAAAADVGEQTIVQAFSDIRFEERDLKAA